MPITEVWKVCQSVSRRRRRRLFCSIEQGNLREKEMSNNQLLFGVTRNTYSSHSKSSENTQVEKVVNRSGKPEERNISNAEIRTS